MPRKAHFLFRCAGLFLAMPTVALADDYTAKDLADGCRALTAMLDSPDVPPANFTVENMGSKGMRAGQCAGWLGGFIAGYSVGRGAPAHVNYCLPKDVSTAQIARLVAKRIEDNPQLEHVGRLEATMGILMGTWPCPNGGGAP
jgi:hypothetical protein